MDSRQCRGERKLFSYAPTSLRITLFGEPRAELDGVSSGPFPTQQSAALLALLALAPQFRVLRDSVADYLWPDEALHVSRRLIRQHLYLVRKAVPLGREIIRSSHNAIWIDGSTSVSVDVLEFAHLLDQANTGADGLDRIERLRRADALYIGPLSPQLDFAYIDDLRRYYAGRHFACLQSLTCLTAEIDLDQAIHFGARAVESEPLDAGSVENLIGLYARARRYEDARRQYRTFERHLREQVGGAPPRHLRQFALSLPSSNQPSSLDDAPVDPRIGRRLLLSARLPRPSLAFGIVCGLAIALAVLGVGYRRGHAGGWIWRTSSVQHSSRALSASRSPFPGPTSPTFANGYALTSIVTGQDHALWFTEDYAYGARTNIGRITTSGETFYFAIPSGDSEGGICCASDGNLWFTEHRMMKVAKLSTEGKVNEYSIPGGGIPSDICAADDGSVWFTVEGNSRGTVWRVDSRGAFQGFKTPSGYESVRITAGPGGSIWFSENLGNRIGRVSRAGVVKEFPLPTEHSYPLGICAGSRGDIWIAEQNAGTIACVTASGTVREFQIPTRGSLPVYIAPGPDGNVWFTEDHGNNIGRIRPDGDITEFPIPNPGRCSGITTGPDGNLWFLEATANKIVRASLRPTYASRLDGRPHRFSADGPSFTAITPPGASSDRSLSGFAPLISALSPTL